MKVWICIFLVLMVCASACERDAQIPDVPDVPTVDEQVLKNCLIIQAAAEAFAIESGGEYPIDPDYDWYGFSLIDFLPDSTRQKNPVTGEATEPVFMEPSGIGSTSYRGVGMYDDGWSMRCVGYLIIGRGEESDTTFTNLPDSVLQLEDRVIENCLIVQAAAEAFADENGGIYPANAGVDETPLGNTLIDLLPGGLLLENPYTSLRTEPIDGAAATPGQTGYMPIVDNGIKVGYSITGFGSFWVIITLYRDPSSEE